MAAFERYLELIIEGNRRANLTAIVDPAQIRLRHFLDSLTIAAAIEPDRISRSRVLDVGSGAGLPGVALAIALPGCRVTLLEATGKKASFLEHVRSELALCDLAVIRDRAETAAHLPGVRESFDIVVSRGVARLSTLVELTMPFCRVGGLFVGYKGREAEAELDAAARALDATGAGEPAVVRVDSAIIGEGRDARLVVVPKCAPSPGRFPRREGVPGRRPL